MRVLVIEDETALAAPLSRQLAGVGYEVVWARTAVEGWDRWQAGGFDLVLLDLGLPDEDGLSLLRRVRAADDVTPVLILTARNAWYERVAGLQAGADDYLGKPFHFEELKARVQALLRRHGAGRSDRLVCGDVVLDLSRHELSVGGVGHTLTAAEFRLLSHLMRQPGRVFSKEQLLTVITDEPYDRDPNMVEVYIRRLRRLVGKSAIETLRGQGYRWVCDER